jgi:hypothetical protein
MTITTLVEPIPKLNSLAAALPLDGAVRIELQQGIPIFRASTPVEERIKMLLHKQREANLTATESDELLLYEEIDDYLSFVNRVVRNLIHAQQQGI